VLPEPIGDDLCGLAERWTLDLALAQGLLDMQRFSWDKLAPAGFRGPDLWIVSGWRSKEAQAGLNPLVTKSRHTFCPSLAADLRVGDLPATETQPAIWQLFGGWWKFNVFGRWGGDFQPTGKFELNHFDLG